MNDGLVDGICCEYCIKKESTDCPVEMAKNWSRWKNFCSEFDNGKFKLNEIIPEIINELIEINKTINHCDAPWWMNDPERGGINDDKIIEFLEKIKGKKIGEIIK